MQDELIQFETAKLAEQAGFDIHCRNSYDVIGGKVHTNMSSIGGMIDTYNRPTQNLLQRWLREKYSLNAEATSRVDGQDGPIVYTWDIYWKGIPKELLNDDEPVFDTYELALESALQEALKLIIKYK
jgi:hypothetical protein